MAKSKLDNTRKLTFGKRKGGKPKKHRTLQNRKMKYRV